LYISVFLTIRHPPLSTLFPYTTLFRSHGIVLKIWQLANVLVKGDRKPAGRIVLPAQRFSDPLAAFLAGIPRFEDRIRVLTGPIHGDRAPIHEHHDQRFSGRSYGFDEGFLGLGQIDAGAVAAEKTGFG